jgi:protein-disulfide isomerase
MLETRAAKKEKMKAQKRTTMLAALLPFAFIAGLLAGYIFWGRDGNQPSPAAAAQPTTAPNLTRYDVSTDDDPAYGPENAPITIVEFSDYQCPYCTQWENQVWPQILKAYGDKIRLVYRDFPLSSIHSQAAQAAFAANCANEQNSYWPYHDKLFESKSGLGESALKEYASELNLDMTAFDECLSSQRYKDEVQADFDYAAKLGVNSTPTFFINGIALIGAQPFEVFKQVIDNELAGKNPQ